MFNKQRKLTKKEIQEFQELNRIAAHYKFVALQIKGNTALIEDGQKVAKQFESITNLMENVKGEWFSNKLRELGYQPNQRVSINIGTGQITKLKEPFKDKTEELKNEPRTN